MSENLASIKRLNEILKEENFSFKKSLGQNFLTDKTVCPRMAMSSADENTGVLEIGPGAGVLTMELSKVARRVVSLEIDKTLEPVLKKTVGDIENVKVIFNDVLKTDIKKLVEEEFADCERVAVCANLPYYITSKIIMQILRSGANISSVTVMVQKEVADRICAKVGSSAAGLFTAEVNYYSKPEFLFKVPKGSFLPSPKVDSAVIRLNVLNKPPVKVNNEEFFWKLLSACFAQRRKTLLNSVSNIMKIEKETLRSALLELGFPETIRGEALSLEALANLSNLLN
ncbi:MAG: 16S rRNA (adenine(1518)-N(6)/adenine(1519)-N(6))-dimethyltransferase RsmA [Clostridia bacterium]|nr:16S rRNA (adenine(1518)-N(6)/adenine(1519)-N(6))-dimethyltransferase RsmA [Clostridia bacterium]